MARKEQAATAILEQPSASDTVRQSEPFPLPKVAPKPETVWDIVQRFRAAIDGHPDARMLAEDLEARPGQHIQFQDTHRDQQRVVSLRFLMRMPPR